MKQPSKHGKAKASQQERKKESVVIGPCSLRHSLFDTSIRTFFASQGIKHSSHLQK